MDPTLSSDRTVLLRAAKSNETGGSICTSNDSVLRGGPILVTYGWFTSEKYMSPHFDRNTPVTLAEFGDNIQRCLWGGGLSKAIHACPVSTISAPAKTVGKASLILVTAKEKLSFHAYRSMASCRDMSFWSAILCKSCNSASFGGSLIPGGAISTGGGSLV
mgnify:CR=1 FL=1